MSGPIFRRPVYRQFIAGRFSLIGLIDLFFLICKIVLPFVVCFATHSFWVREREYTERPHVTSTGKFIISLGGVSGDHTDSSILAVQKILGTNDMTTTFKEKVEDFNKDGRANQITLNVRSCLQTADTIISAKFMYFPQYQLIDPIPLTLESFVYLSHIGSVGGNALVSEGKIVLSQNRPLRMRPLLKVPLLLNTSLVIPFKNMTTEYFVHRVVTDDESAVLSSPYPPEWLPAASTSCFDIHLVINIVPQKVRYTPSLFEVLKFAWIQYIAIFILFGAVIEWIERKIFDNQILATLVQDEKLRSISSFCQSTSFSSYVHAKEHPHRL